MTPTEAHLAAAIRLYDDAKPRGPKESARTAWVRALAAEFAAVDALKDGGA